MDQKGFEEQITAAEKQLGIVIPAIYKRFLLEHNQMEFDDGILYDISQIAERFQTLEFDRYAPDYIPIGNDNGDYELVMKSGSSITRFGILEQGSIGTCKPDHLQNFAQWFANGHSFQFEAVKEPADWSAKVKVILKKCPENKAQTMMRIRKALGLDTPASELLRSAEKAPVILTDSLTYAVARAVIAESALAEWLDIQF